MTRVSVYIDGANFLGGIKSINEKYKDWKFDFEKYVKHISKKYKLIDVYYYTAALKQDKNPDMYKLQQRLFERLRQAKFLVRIAKRQPRYDADGSTSSKIKGDDI